MNICYIALDFHTENSGGGIASYVSTVGRELARRGHRITVLAKGRRYRITEDEGIKVVQVPLGNLHWYLYKGSGPRSAILPLRELEWSLAIRKHLRRLLDSDGYGPLDIIEGCETGNLFTTSSARFPPLVIRLHGDPYVFRKYSGQPIDSGLKIIRQFEIWTLHKAAAITSPSSIQAEEFHRAMRLPRKIYVIPNPIDPILLEQAPNVVEHRHRKKRALVLYTGRIEWGKGTIPLLNSVPLVAEKIPGVKYVIAGGRHNSIDDKLLQRTLDQDLIARHVQLLGHVPWQSLFKWYERSSVFIMPSYYETFGISVIEAMAFGLPVVATTAGALPEVVEDGVTGLLVPPGDFQALADAVITLLRDDELRYRMGRTAQERVAARFNVETIATETLQVYSHTIHNSVDRLQRMW